MVLLSPAAATLAPDPKATTPRAAAAPLGPSRPRRDLAALERLGDRIAELAAHLDAARYRLLVMIREFDEHKGWHDGFKSCAHWLSWRTSLAPGAAREHVRIARALGRLPLMSEAMRKGELSYSKARALTRIATPENEAELVELARHATAAHIERIVAGWTVVDRNVEAAREAEAHARRELTILRNGDGSYDIKGRVDAEVAQVLLKALAAAEEQLYPDLSARRGVPAHHRRADALGVVAEGALGGGIGTGSRADRFQVVVHVQAEGPVARDDALRVSAETSRRLACDAGRVVMTHDAAGSVLDVGRKTRTVPPAIRRALEHRDSGCRFPGCTNRYCDAHHVKHWAAGGETRLDNLVSLCRVHHRLLHEGGYRVEQIRVRTPGRSTELRFTDPLGRVLPEVPRPPAIPRNAVEMVKLDNRNAGVEVSPWTATPRWNGERLDLGYAISVLWRPPRVSAET